MPRKMLRLEGDIKNDAMWHEKQKENGRPKIGKTSNDSWSRTPIHQEETDEREDKTAHGRHQSYSAGGR